MENKSNARESFGEAAGSIAPMGIMMAFFMLIYTIWWGFAFGMVGWILFVLSCVFALYLVFKSIRNIKHANRFPKNKSSECERIGKQMGILSGISYGILWIAAIILALMGLYQWILPVVTFIIAVHFFPQAKIFNRKIDYYLAPFPLATSIIGFYLAVQPGVDWSIVYAVTGTGGAIATGGYGIFMLITYRHLAKEAGVL